MGNRCQPSRQVLQIPWPSWPPGQPGCGFALEPKHLFKGFLSPSTCLGFNSVLAHLSWVIKHERAEPRDLPMLCREGRGKPLASPRSAWERGKRCPHRGTCPCCPCCLDTAGPSAVPELQRLHPAHTVPQAAWKGGAEQADPRRRWQHCILHLLPCYSRSTDPGYL